MKSFVYKSQILSTISRPHFAATLLVNLCGEFGHGAGLCDP